MNEDEIQQHYIAGYLAALKQVITLLDNLDPADFCYPAKVAQDIRNFAHKVVTQEKEND
jgi:hypothetical protein